MSILDELAQVANKDVQEDFQSRSKAKREARVTKKGVGKTVACYVSAEDVKKLEQAAELLSSSQSGVLHTALMVYLEKLLGIEQSGNALVEVAKTVEREWLPGRLPDPHGTITSTPTPPGWKPTTTK